VTGECVADRLLLIGRQLAEGLLHVGAHDQWPNLVTVRLDLTQDAHRPEVNKFLVVHRVNNRREHRTGIRHIERTGKDAESGVQRPILRTQTLDDLREGARGRRRPFDGGAKGGIVIAWSVLNNPNIRQRGRRFRQRGIVIAWSVLNNPEDRGAQSQEQARRLLDS
jgi:hypothetical protein